MNKYLQYKIVSLPGVKHYGVYGVRMTRLARLLQYELTSCRHTRMQTCQHSHGETQVVSHKLLCQKCSFHLDIFVVVFENIQVNMFFIYCLTKMSNENSFDMIMFRVEFDIDKSCFL